MFSMIFLMFLCYRESTTFSAFLCKLISWGNWLIFTDNIFFGKDTLLLATTKENCAFR